MKSIKFNKVWDELVDILLQWRHVNPARPGLVGEILDGIYGWWNNHKGLKIHTS